MKETLKLLLSFLDSKKQQHSIWKNQISTTEIQEPTLSFERLQHLVSISFTNENVKGRDSKNEKTATTTTGLIFIHLFHFF